MSTVRTCACKLAFPNPYKLQVLAPTIYSFAVTLTDQVPEDQERVIADASICYASSLYLV